MVEKCRIRGCDNAADVSGFCKPHFKELDSILMEDGRSIAVWLVAGKKWSPEKPKLSGSVYEKEGQYWAIVDMDSGEEHDIEHPSTFGYTEDVGPFDTEAEAQQFLRTGVLDSTKQEPR